MGAVGFGLLTLARTHNIQPVQLADPYLTTRRALKRDAQAAGSPVLAVVAAGRMRLTTTTRTIIPAMIHRSGCCIYRRSAMREVNSGCSR